jgi:hypothetical protein
MRRPDDFSSRRRSSMKQAERPMLYLKEKTEKTDFSASSAFSAVIAYSAGLGVDNGPQRF